MIVIIEDTVTITDTFGGSLPVQNTNYVLKAQTVTEVDGMYTVELVFTPA